MERKQQMLKFFDKIISMKLKGISEGKNQLETAMLGFIKRLEKTIARYIKLWEMPDEIAPNFVHLRDRNSLRYYHFQWQDGQINFECFVEIAIVIKNF